ncbi:glycosyltransferase family 39 protein [Neorhizobium lilium]|uniref:Glycosyltransferase family 39 protein n=1 Tax=Neorhizobium lilium TaxID=2503024 RepID=A0A3S3S8C9_9HYPH|nr:glycosyltransferase family 39 protein [Neorhizobium lilium]
MSSAVAVVISITAWRILMLAFDRTDLFVDEAQYWLWSQNLDFGYYSKPPMIGWVIRLFTVIGGSDSSFWVRLPAPLFHMATALLLMPIASRTIRREAAPWAAMTFATLPAVSLSCVLMSTDTIQLTFLAVAILLFLRLTEASSAMAAIGLGLSLGFAFLTKYSVLFLLPGVGLAMLTLPTARISWRDALIAAAVGTLVVSPNLWWNYLHQGITIQHTESIANWSGSDGKSGLRILSGLSFFAAQFAVVGPIVFIAMLWAAKRVATGQSGDGVKLLAWLSLPCVALLTLQAFFGGANANWAVPAYVAGTVLATGVMMTMPWTVVRTSLVISAIPMVLIPVMTAFPMTFKLPNGELLMKRYMGRSIISSFAADTARKENIRVIVADNRPILADLFYTLREEDLAIYARPISVFPANYYEQIFPMPISAPSPVLYLSESKLTCQGEPAEVAARWLMPFGYRAGHVFYAYKVDPSCLLPVHQALAQR